MAVTKPKKRISKENRIYTQVYDAVKVAAINRLIGRGYTYQETSEMIRLAKLMVGKVEKRTDEEVTFTPGKDVVLDRVKHGRISPRDLNDLKDVWADALASPKNAELIMSKFRPAGPEKEVAIRMPKPPRKEKLFTYDVTLRGKNYAVAVKKDLNKVVKNPTNWMEKTKAYQLRAALLSGDVIAVTTGKGKTIPPKDFLSDLNNVYGPLFRKPGLKREDIYQKIEIHKRR